MMKKSEDRPGPTTRRGAAERSLHIVEILIEAPAPMGIAEIAAATGLEPNSTHRLLQKLIALGYVHRHAATKRFSAGPQALFPKSIYHPLNALRQDVREQLRSLRERFYESVCLIVFIGYERLIVDFIQGREALSPLYETKLTNPLHGSAGGIILLSELPEAERRELLGKEPYPAPTAHTITRYAQLQEEFESLKRSGYAVSEQATFVGVNTVAAPIRSQQRTIGCLAMTGSAETMTKQHLVVLGEALRDSANLVSAGAPSVKAVANFLGA